MYLAKRYPDLVKNSKIMDLARIKPILVEKFENYVLKSVILPFGPKLQSLYVLLENTSILVENSNIIFWPSG